MPRDNGNAGENSDMIGASLKSLIPSRLRKYLRPAFERIGLLRKRWAGAPAFGPRHRYFYSGPAPISEETAGWFEKRFWSNEGLAIRKWHHYLPVYERHFSPWRNRRPRILEIGVQNGGSAQMWRDYFGQDAVVFGIDIDRRCERFDGEAASIRIGSQDDPIFLRKVVEEMGGIDIVLDDGSHLQRHVLSSFKILFPLLSQGGVYMVEDVHTAYWHEYGGAKGKPDTFIEFSKRVIDDMHHWYHGLSIEEEVCHNRVSGIHFYDSVVVFDKDRIGPPKDSITGVDSAIFDPRQE